MRDRQQGLNEHGGTTPTHEQSVRKEAPVAARTCLPIDSAHRPISVHHVDDGRRVYLEESISHALDYHRTMSRTNGRTYSVIEGHLFKTVLDGFVIIVSVVWVIIKTMIFSRLLV